jgi:hypothetical protein
VCTVVAVGIDRRGQQFLEAARASGVDFSRLCTIGRQDMTVAGLSRAEYADGVFRGLGAHTVDALDISDYEGATVVHDLNGAEPPEVTERYTAVLDGGSLEHIFHVPNALRSITSLVEVGGHVLFINPTDGNSGHGFYQFSPEFFFRVLSPENGFRMVSCYYRELGRRPWYEVPDPASIGRRVEISARTSAYLYVVAQKVSAATPFEKPPLQSDYVATWMRDPDPRRSRLERIPRRLRGLALWGRATQQLMTRPWASPSRAGLTKVELRRGPS